jgi:nucleoside phosphorylase
MNSLNKIALIAAMKTELPNSIRYTKKGVNTLAVSSYLLKAEVSGVGFKNALRATEIICQDFKPDLILHLGFCGSVGAEFKIGDLCLAHEFYYQDMKLANNTDLLSTIQAKLKEKTLRHHLCRIKTFRKPVLCKSSLTDNIHCVDMESFAIARKASEYGIPALVIKAVSDILPVQKPLFLPEIRLNFRIVRNYPRAKRSLNTFFEDLPFLLNNEFC